MLIIDVMNTACGPVAIGSSGGQIAIACRRKKLNTAVDTQPAWHAAAGQSLSPHCTTYTHNISPSPHTSVTQPHGFRSLNSSSMWMKWAGHVARMGEDRKCTRFCWESRKERDHSEDQGKMGLEWILRRLAWGCELDSTSSGYGHASGCCEFGDEPSGSCTTELVG
jgi:hypothetical protein